jgi:hypothetical protein
VPVNDLSAKQLIARLNTRMDRELHEASQRRIATLAIDELAPAA